MELLASKSKRITAQISRILGKIYTLFCRKLFTFQKIASGFLLGLGRNQMPNPGT